MWTPGHRPASIVPTQNIHFKRTNDHLDLNNSCLRARTNNDTAPPTDLQDPDTQRCLRFFWGGQMTLSKFSCQRFQGPSKHIAKPRFKKPTLVSQSNIIATLTQVLEIHSLAKVASQIPSTETLLELPRRAYGRSRASDLNTQHQLHAQDLCLAIPIRNEGWHPVRALRRGLIRPLGQYNEHQRPITSCLFK